MQSGNQEKMHPVENTWSVWMHLPNFIRVSIKRTWNKLGFSVESGTLLRFEFDMLLLRVREFSSLTHRKKIRIYRKRKKMLLHLGCGNTVLSDWVNMDCYPPPPSSGAEIIMHDMRNHFDFSSDSVSAVFSEHFFEHIDMEITRDILLPDIYRVLEHNGTVRFSVPNGAYFLEQYRLLKEGKADPTYLKNTSCRTGMIEINEIARAVGHKYLYDFETFSLFLKEAGFEDIKQKIKNDSDYDVYADLDRQNDWRGRMSLYIEARVYKI